ncbi:hypothetical protein NDU88_004421 [Pleurodeles waltl]|uniref:Uncharacterized protein n=1 Tax=Pleurodeles waltl TaxID=8319 RepID=A0AAV7QCZ4_PLEWA|nr:hypothetical protein NDU88_004421 [Pleurodeles waltl]
MQGPATPLSNIDVSVTAEKDPGSPPFTGSPRFHCLENREALPISLAVLRSPLLRSFPLSSGSSGPLLLAPEGPPRSKYRRPPWRLPAAARSTPRLAATRVPGSLTRTPDAVAAPRSSGFTLSGVS